jgi:putative transposase
VILTYRYRLLPSKRQHAALVRLLDEQRALYNAALEERIDCYQKTGKSLTYIDQTMPVRLSHTDPKY